MNAAASAETPPGGKGLGDGCRCAVGIGGFVLNVVVLLAVRPIWIGVALAVLFVVFALVGRSR